MSQQKMSITYDVVLQINNANGKRLGEIEIGYKKNNKIKNLEGKILDSFGREIKTLKTKDIRDRNYIDGRDSYSDYMIKEFDLIHDRFPYLVQFSYTITYDQFIYQRWSPFYKNKYTENATLTLETPKDYQFTSYVNGMTKSEEELISNDTKRYVWTAKELSPVEIESYSPPKNELSPSVYIVPDNFYYGGEGSGESWEKYGDWVHFLGKYCNDLSGEQIQSIKESARDLDKEKDIVRMLYNKLQDETRYINVSLSIGGMMPYPASYVASNNFGDCKALTYYMKSMLEAVDIASYPVDVYWDDNPVRIKKDIPTQQFNHVFLCVPIGEDTIWLENTSNSYPFDYIDTSKQGEYGLFIRKNGSKLIKLPKMDFEDVHEARKFDIYFEDGNLKGKLDATYKGEWFESFSYIIKNFSVPDQKSWMKRYFPVNSANLEGWELIKHDRNDHHITLQANFDLPRSVKRYGETSVVYVPEFSLPQLEKPENRTIDLRFRVPVFKTDTIEVNVDGNIYQQVETQQPRSVVSPFGNYQIEFINEKDKILCIKSLKIAANELQLGKAYQEFYEFINEIQSIERNSYIKVRK